MKESTFVKPLAPFASSPCSTHISVFSMSAVAGAQKKPATLRCAALLRALQNNKQGVHVRKEEAPYTDFFFHPLCADESNVLAWRSLCHCGSRHDSAPCPCSLDVNNSNYVCRYIHALPKMRCRWILRYTVGPPCLLAPCHSLL